MSRLPERCLRPCSIVYGGPDLLNAPDVSSAAIPFSSVKLLYIICICVFLFLSRMPAGVASTHDAARYDVFQEGRKAIRVPFSGDLLSLRPECSHAGWHGSWRDAVVAFYSGSSLFTAAMKHSSLQRVTSPACTPPAWGQSYYQPISVLIFKAGGPEHIAVDTTPR